MLSRFTDLILGRPKTVILLLVVLTVGLGAGMRRLTADTDVTNDLPQRIPAKRLYDRIAELFPAKELVIVCIEDNKLLTVDGVRRLARLTRLIEEQQGVQSVLGPANARIISASPEGLVVREAADPLPRTAQELQVFRERLFGQPMLKGTLITADAKAIAMLVFVKAGVREADVAERLVRIAEDPRRNGGFALWIGGRAAATYWSKVIMGRDMGMLSSAALAVVIVLLLLSFRSVRGVLLPLGVVIASVSWTLGLMGYAGIPITHSTEVMPILLIAIGVADGIHILKGYYAHARSGRSPRETVRATMADLNRPVVLTSLTTSVGFLALNTSGIESIMTLGFLTAFGVLAAMVFSLTFIPATLALTRLPRSGSAGGRETGRTRFEGFEGLAAAYAGLLVRRKGAVAAGILAVIGLAIFGATRVPVEMSNIDNFRPDHPLREATERINRHFGGITNLIVVVDGGRKDAIKDPAVLQKMDALEQFLRTKPHVGSIQSVVGFIKQMHRVMHGDSPAEYRLPKRQETERGIETVEVDGEEVDKEVEFTVAGKDLVAQYLALYELSGKPGDFANVATYDFSTAKINVFIDSDKASVLDALVTDVRRFINSEFKGLNAELTGMAELIRAVNNMVVTGQGWSIATSLLLVFVVSSLMFRSPVLGLFSTLPLFFSLFLNFGVMGLRGIALNVMTMATSSVAVGVGIDYAIHFVHRYQQELAGGAAFGEAVPVTMRSSGVAILLNAVTVAAGFMALVFSEFRGVAEMGFLIALTMITSAFAALTILPVVFVWLRPRAFIKTYKPPSQTAREA